MSRVASPGLAGLEPVEAAVEGGVEPSVDPTPTGAGVGGDVAVTVTCEEPSGVNAASFPQPAMTPSDPTAPHTSSTRRRPGPSVRRRSPTRVPNGRSSARTAVENGFRNGGVPAAICFVVWMVRLVTAGDVPLDVSCGAPKLQVAPFGSPEQDRLATPV